MSYTISIVPQAEKFLKKLHQSQPGDAEAIEDAIELLSKDPRPRSAKILKGYKDVWRRRVGNYRVCYQINDRKLIILIVTISTRDDVYGILRR